MKIPFVDLHAQYLSIQSEIDTAIQDVIQHTAFIGGKHVDAFEENFSNLYGSKYCIPVANGTDSLFIIMKMLGIGPGDEVITAANSWISSSETISQTGATPVFCDVSEEYYTLDEKHLEKLINSKTKAIIPVHIHGQMCEMDSIMRIANDKNIPVIEDCAQSHFSELNGIRAGLRGIAGSFSFYPGKNLGAYGDAGCIITQNEELAKKCKMYARHGALKKHAHEIEGINSRLDGLQAAILNAKLPHILEWTEKRIQNANLYYTYLSNIPSIQLPKVRANSKHTFHLFVVQAENRNELINHLKENGIETAIHYPTILPLLKAYSYLNKSANDFPIASKQGEKIISLPMYPELNEEKIKFISDTIRSFYK